MPGIKNREEAIHHVEECILKEIRAIQAKGVLDLGCGVGGSLAYLARRWQAGFYGITLSSVQAQLGQAHMESAGLADGCRISQGDFLDPDTLSLWREESRGPRVAFAVESFIHAREAAAFFLNAAGSLGTGDRLIICDDLLTEKGRRVLSDTKERSAVGRRICRRQRRWLEDHRRGWHALNRLTLTELRETAEKHGFRIRRLRDLSPHLELRRPRDRIIRLAVAAGRLLPIHGSAWDNLLGGNALQRCLESGLMTYVYISLEKIPITAA